MADLSFMSQLTPEQRQYADVIRERAQQIGVPPDLAVAVAYQESRLNPQSKQSGKGAVGIMQVRPIAAREVGVNPEELSDPSVNIDAGLKYLKQALTATGDPRAAVVYYNAGPKTLETYGQGGDLPQETEQYLRSLYAYGAFKPQSAETAAERPSEPTAAASSGYELPERIELQNRTPQQQQAERASLNAREKNMAQLAGLGAGTTISALRAGKGMASGAMQAAGQALGQGMAAGTPGAAGAPAAPPAGAPGAPVGGGAPAVGGAGAAARPSVIVNPVPRAEGFGSGIINYGTRFGVPFNVAAEATGMGATKDEIWEQARGIGQGGQKAKELYPGRLGQVDPVTGIQVVQPAGGVPRSRTVFPEAPGALPQQVIPPARPVPPKLSGLEQITQMFSQAARSGLEAIKPKLAFGQRYVVPPLALAQGAGELVSAKQSMEQGDPLGAALRGLGGVGSIASMATPAALPVAIGAPLAQAFRERMAENVKRFPADTRPLSPEEEEKASGPAVFYRSGWRRPSMPR